MMRIFMEGKLLYPQLSYRISGLCFKAHNDLGRFCKEKQYADRFEKLLKENNIKYQREIKIGPGNIFDFLIEDKIVVDLKAKKFITKEDYFQMQRYLQSANIKLGLIVNFRSTYLKPKRVINYNLS